MSADPPDDDVDDLYDSILDAELDELAAGLDLDRRPLPEDIDALMCAIDMRAAVRVGAPDEPPYHFGRFEAFDMKFGGMGMVIEARDPQLDRKVAIKLWMASGPEAEASLVAEAKLLAMLTHPNVVRVYDTGKWEGWVYFVMEWVEGQDGHRWMEERPRIWWEVRDVFVAAGRGLAAAHDAGIQHRDFKPANMLVGHDGRVLVADFGIADLLRGVDEAKQMATPAGTPTYMAPERLRGERGDARSDQFSFCVALWKGLYGVRPFGGQTREELLEFIEGGQIQETTSLAVARWLRDVVLVGLELDPDDRFADMHELVVALLDEPSPDAGRDDDELDDDAPPEPDERVLHSPTATIPPAKRGRHFLYGVLTGGVAVGGLVVGIQTLRPMQRADRQLTAEAAPEGDEPPIALDLPAETKPVVSVEEIIAKIDAGEYDDADSEWDAATMEIELRGTTTHAESLEVSAAYLVQAEDLRDRRQFEDALVTVDLARKWALAAKTNLAKHGKPPQAANVQLGKVKELAMTLRVVPNQSK